MIEARVLAPLKTAQPQPEALPKDSRDSSRKRKSKSPHVDLSHNKKQKRKAAQQAESRIQMLPQGLLPKTPQTKDSLAPTSSDEDEGGNINIVRRKQKSILQPSGGKYSKKAAARRRGSAFMEQENWGEDENDEDHKRIQSEESPITTIRSARHLENLTNPPTERASPDAPSPPRFLPRKYLELKAVEYDLMSTEPQGPGELWTCTFDGCFHRVHEASTSEGKRRVQEHFKSHASQAQEKIELALHESRPYLPVK